MSRLKDKVNIIVIGYGPKVKALEKQCFNTVIRNTVYPYYLTYIDNYSSGLSLTEAWNIFINLSPSKYQVLLNNDTEVSPYWLTKMIEVFDKHEDAFAVGPSTNSCHSIQNTIGTQELADKHKDKIVKLDFGQHLSGFCLVLKKEIFNKLGGLDERYPLYGSESDLLDKAQRAGYNLYWRKETFIFHHGEQSVKAAENLDVEKEREKAKKLYWSERK
jgi:hypothetical protein